MEFNVTVDTLFEGLSITEERAEEINTAITGVFMSLASKTSSTKEIIEELKDLPLNEQESYYVAYHVGSFIARMEVTREIAHMMKSAADQVKQQEESSRH